MERWQEPKTMLAGKFLGIPYDFRFPWLRVVRERFWNPEDRRIFTPHVLGWGWSINFYRIGRLLRLAK
jgi:hypothetical protein